MAIIKNNLLIETTNPGEDVEKKKSLYIAGRNIYQLRHLGKQYEGFLTN